MSARKRRRRSGSRVGGGAAAVIFALGATEAASAAPNPLPNPPAPPDPGPVDPIYRTPVEYYAATYHVTKAEAQRRLDLQAKVRGLEQRLVERLGGRFAQVWFDNEIGKWVVFRSPTGDDEGARRAVAALGLASTEFVVRAETFTRGELAASSEALQKRLLDEIGTGRVTVGVVEGGLAVRMARTATASDRAAVEDAAQTVAVKPTVTNTQYESFKLKPDQCSHPYCNTVVAGVRYHNLRVSCTAGFHVKSTVDSRNFILTAGHCLSGGNPAWWTCKLGGSPCPLAGNEVGGYYGGGGGDAAVSRIDNPVDWPAYPGWVNWHSNGITRQSAAVDPSGGEVLCQNGATTGSACGTVGSPSASVTYKDQAQLTGMVRIDNTCANGGDSGGPWTFASQTWAAGIHSGSTGGCGATAYAEPINRALSTLGVYLPT